MYINVLLFISIIVNSILSGALLLKQRKALSTVFYSISVFWTAVWVAAMFVYRTIAPEYVLYPARTLYLAGILIAYAFFLFAITYPKVTRWFNWWLVGGMGLITAVSVVLVYTPSFITSVNVTADGTYLTFGSATYLPYSISMIVLFFMGLLRLQRMYQVHDGIIRTQALFLMVGSSVAIFSGLLFDIVLPYAGIFTFYWLGPILTMFMVMSIGYVIIRHRFSDVRIRLQSIVDHLVPFITATIVSFLFLLIVWDQYSGLSLLGLFVAIFAINWVIYFAILRVLSYTGFTVALFGVTKPYRRALKQLAHRASTILDLDQLLGEVEQVFSEEMHISDLAVLTRRHGTNNFLFRIQSGFSDEQLNMLTTPEKPFLKAFVPGRSVYIIDQMPYEIHALLHEPEEQERLQQIYDTLKGSGAAAVVVLQVQKLVTAWVVLGALPSRSTYTSDDIDLLERVAQDLSYAFVNAQLHESAQDRAIELQEQVAHATKELRTRSRENAELSNIKSQFIEVLAHQLRTPMTVIYNTANELQDRVETATEETQSDVAHLYQASHVMRTTIENILSAAEFIGGKPTLHLQQVDLHGLLQKHIDLLDQLVDAQQTVEHPSDKESTITVEYHISENVPSSIVSDREKLGLILETLITNAVTYTQKGSIFVKAKVEEADERELVITVRDTGIGIPSESHEYVFQRFTRLAEAVRMSPNGTGLGLYLAQQYVELFQGSISLESMPHEGTSVTVRIPLQHSYVL